jgi:lipid II:glycine glycyltransferase (peptidoglycan interpeptide bridge formation enzyme)
MLTTYSLDSEAEMKQWDEFVQSHPQGSPYHLSQWIKVLRETYSFEPYLYGLKRDGGELQGVLPFFLVRSFLTGSRFVSMPFSDYGGPLFRDESDGMECLKEIVERNGKKVKYMEIRGQIPEGSGFVCHNYYKRHLLALSSDLGAVRKNIDKRTIQYSIRKAEKVGIRIEEVNSESGMSEFYRLNSLTRKKHGVPGQPKRYFEILYREMIAKGLGFVLLAVHESKVVAGSLFLNLGKGIHYKYNASDPDILGKITPNHSLTWQAIVKGCKEGYEFIDFGRTSPDNEGLMRYKEMWGVRCLDLPYYYYPAIHGAVATKESGLAYRIETGIWRKLPDFIVEKLGPRLYRHMG